MIQKGRDLEKLVLSRAVKLHLQHRVMPLGNRTVVF
jgi:formyltetrahydrofolate deformylase